MDTDSAIDLSTRNRSPTAVERVDDDRNEATTILRPIPRPAWSIIWYQKLWSHYTQTAIKSSTHHQRFTPNSLSGYPNEKNKCDSAIPNCQTDSQVSETIVENRQDKISEWTSASSYPQLELPQENLNGCSEENSTKDNDSSIIGSRDSTSVLDIACCDGPVKFERISNPNFALTVEHNSGPSNVPIANSSSVETTRNIATKTYLCIYCNQSFKSLFCYQKHKKRHLNPVSVDITATHLSTPRVSNFENRSNCKTKDLNVQFFPCKKCGCKFPSYYFVHKHKKICH